jgi:hypothetical protein
VHRNPPRLRGITQQCHGYDSIRIITAFAAAQSGLEAGGLEANDE